MMVNVPFLMIPKMKMIRNSKFQHLEKYSYFSIRKDIGKSYWNIFMTLSNKSDNDILGIDIVLLKESVPYASVAPAHTSIESGFCLAWLEECQNDTYLQGCVMEDDLYHQRVNNKTTNSA